MFSAFVAQVLNPVKWTFSSRKISDTEAELVFKAQIDKGWHLYSQFIDDGGPIPTKFTIEKSKNFQLIGKVTEGKPEKIHDQNFGIDLLFFQKNAEFKQKLKITSLKPFEVKGKVDFMVCDDSRCLPPDAKEFSIQLEGMPAKTLTDTLPKSVKNSSLDAGPADTNQSAKIDSLKTGVHSKSNTIIAATAPVPVVEHSSWGIFILGFFGGLLALLTPCVFPMIPLTVSFFTKRSKTREQGIANAIIYGISIIVLYVSLGLLITFSLGPDALNALASNVFMNLAFFVVFVVFSISFLGAFEITLPASWVNKADTASDRGGLLGIFFMAFTLALVSFSCTGPIIGTLLVEAAVGGNVLNPTLGMAGFATALALPFALFAAFPAWLNSLPKSGSWLNSVKVVLGLLELALALKFLSNVDLAYHWGILKREVFIALWIVIFSMLGFYLLGKLKFSHDSEQSYTSIPRALLAILTFSFVVYMIPGMWGAPLKLISGFPPPIFYNEGWDGANGGAAIANSTLIEGTDPAHCPHNLSCFHDYDKALAYARQTGKPLMVDFTGWSCVNCRKMEEKVWIDPKVLSRLQNDYVLVSLYVDDKTPLPENQQYTSATTNKKVKTIGNKWSDLQTTRFMTNSQPLYVLLDHQEMELISPIGYTPDIDEYVNYLEIGKTEFKKRNLESSHSLTH